MLELGTGTSGTPANDAGIVIERGSADNAFFGWDEQANKFVVGTGSFTGASTGDLAITTAILMANLESSSVNITGGTIQGITDLAVADGGTGIGAVAKGSLLVANTANTLSALDIIIYSILGYYFLGKYRRRRNLLLMATAIQIKRGTGSAAPVAADLIEGELAYAEDRSNNGASAKLYISSINSSSAEVIQTIGGKYYTDIVDAATNANTASKLVKRDGSGNFSAGTITANVTGNVSGTAGSATGNAATATKIASITNSNIVQLAETQTLTNKTLTSPVLNTGISGSAIKDQDDMSSNSATHIATQQSVKAYVDTQVATAASVDDATALAIALG